MKFTVILIRPVWFIDTLPDFDSVQTLQYAATNIEAPDQVVAAKQAQQEALDADKHDWVRRHIEENGPITEDDHDLRELDTDAYTVLGVFIDGAYTPWLNGRRP